MHISWYQGQGHLQRSRSNIRVMFSKDGCFGGISVSQTHLVFMNLCMSWKFLLASTLLYVFADNFDISFDSFLFDHIICVICFFILIFICFNYIILQNTVYVVCEYQKISIYSRISLNLFTKQSSCWRKQAFEYIFVNGESACSKRFLVLSTTTLSLKNNEPFPKQTLVFTCLQFKTFENNVGKREIAHNKQFLLFPQCLPLWRTFCHYHQILNCRWQTLSVWKSLKFVFWERVRQYKCYFT